MKKIILLSPDKVVNGPLESAYDAPNSHLTVELWMVTTEVTREAEVLLYTWQHLVADFGGTLGLFLGFSFMTLWDGMARLEKMAGQARKIFPGYFRHGSQRSGLDPGALKPSSSF